MQKLRQFNLILYSFNLNPSNSLITAEKADNVTTFVALYTHGSTPRPLILYGFSISLIKKKHLEEKI
jgi:hypothetical protein